MKTFLFIAIMLTASSLFAGDKLGTGESFYDKLAIQAALAQIDARQAPKVEAPKPKVEAHKVSVQQAEQVEQEIQGMVNTVGRVFVFCKEAFVEAEKQKQLMAEKEQIKVTAPVSFVSRRRPVASGSNCPGGNCPTPTTQTVAPSQEAPTELPLPVPTVEKIVKPDPNLVPNLKGNTLKPQKEVIVKPDPTLVPNLKGNTLKPQKEVIVKPDPNLVPNFKGTKAPKPGAYGDEQVSPSEQQTYVEQAVVTRGRRLGRRLRNRRLRFAEQATPNMPTLAPPVVETPTESDTIDVPVYYEVSPRPRFFRR
ncbi:MAG: hypothetical protein M0R80_00765 [Proteobacteria bacterium]|jgi:hypothetical protein|nr:hypothetical protein [Pseudomonadota bacterium]